MDLSSFLKPSPSVLPHADTTPFLSKRERVGVSLFASVVSFILLLPYVIGVLVQKEGSLFLGTPLFAIADYRSYLAWIGQAMHGEVLFFNYSATPLLSSDGVLFHPIFFTLGMFGKWFHLDPPLLFHAASALCAGLLVFTVYRFFARCTSDVLWRATATGLFVFATGFGALFFAPNTALAGPEFSMLVRMQQYLLGSIDTILTFAIFTLALSDLRRGRLRDAVLLGLMIGMLILIHPYMLLIVLGTLGLFALFLVWVEKEWTVMFALLRATAVLLPFVWWQVAALAADASFALWFFSGMLTPRFGLFELFLGYGLLLPLALVGVFGVVRAGRDTPHLAALVLLSLWGVVMFLGMEQPFFLSVTRRFGEMLFIPIVFFAAYPLVLLLRMRKGVWFVLPMLFLLVLGNMLFFSRLLGAPFVDRSDPTSTAYAPLDVLTPDARAVLAWLDRYTDREDVVLSGGALGSIIPIFADTRVVFGHPSLMPGEEGKNLLVPLLFRAGTSSRAWPLFLRDISYIVVDDDLRALGYDPKKDPYGEPVFRNETYEVYRVVGVRE